MHLKIALLKKSATCEIKRHEAGQRVCVLHPVHHAPAAGGGLAFPRLRLLTAARWPAACARAPAQSGQTRRPAGAVLTPAASQGRPLLPPQTPEKSTSALTDVFLARDIPAACTPQLPLTPGVQAGYIQGHTAATSPLVLPVGGSGASHAACSSSPPSPTVTPCAAAPLTQGPGSPPAPQLAP